jgi:hypothetical protein
MLRLAFVGAVWTLAANPAVAQRDAISSSLSPEAAAKAFQDTVTGICVPAVAGGGLSTLPAGARAKLQASSDPVTRQQSGAAADENVWDVLSSKGVVVVREKPGRCTVSVYGPPAMTTIMTLAGALTVSPYGFERLVAAPPTNGLSQSLTRMENGKRLMVLLTGSEPGMPGHKSRFGVVTATVFVAS